jgi:hypothetical protein
MRRVEIARRLALFARAAERRGNHARAAELFAAALQALLRGSQAPGEPELEANDVDAAGHLVPSAVPLVSAAEECGVPDGNTAMAAASTKPIEGVTG